MFKYSITLEKNKNKNKISIFHFILFVHAFMLYKPILLSFHWRQIFFFF